jgi:hypothetical protein
MLRTFFALRHTDPGFDVDRLVSFSLVPEIAGPNAHIASTFPPDLPEDLLQRVQQLPGVAARASPGRPSCSASASKPPPQFPDR